MGTWKSCSWIILGALVLCKGSIFAQQQDANTPNQLDFPVGVWESVQADGTTIGIDLSEVSARIQGEKQAAGKETDRKAIQVGVFRKKHQRIACGEENFFIIGEKDNSHDSSESYGHGRLEIHYHDHVSGLEIQLMLTRDPIKDIWTSRFRRDGFDVLMRDPIKDVGTSQFRRDGFDGEVVLHRTSHRPDPAQGGCFSGGSKS